jgi:putative nucleotidyltransferase-like protein
MLMDRVHGSPELQLLVASAHPNLSPQAAARVRALTGKRVDWSSVLRLAGKHGVRPLLYRSLSTACPESVPAAVLEELLTFVRSDAAHNLSQNVELVGLLEGLSERGIPAIPFKGGVLADWAYADPSLRESGDIDIVVRRRHLREAIAFLLTREYCSGSSGRYLRFDRIDGLASVDLQTSLEAPHFSFALDNDELWDRAVRRMFVGHSVLSYCAEDLLILLCVHGTKDVWFKLKWTCDIAAFIERKPDWDWERVLVRAASLHARRKLLFGCWLAHDLLGAGLPEVMLTRIRREPSVLTCASRVAEVFPLFERRFTNTERAALYFRTADPGDRRRVLRYVRPSLRALVRPSENDRRWVSLPAWLSAVYYLIRPIRLLTLFARPRVAAKALREMFESLD